MADISILQRLILGYNRNVDLSKNALVVGSLKVGSGTPTELTQTILNNLLTMQNGSDFSTGTNAHTHDGRYNTIGQTASTTSGLSGASLTGVSGSPVHYTASAPNVQKHLEGIDTALATAGAGTVKNTSSDTTPDYLSNKVTVSSGLIQTTTSPGGNEKMNLAVDPTVYVPQSSVGSNSGVASLDSGGKVPVSQLPNSVMEYKGTYNASTNTPTLVDGTGNTGDVYRVTVAGAGVDSLNFVVGDYAIYNGTTWEKAHSGADNVTSVNGFAGVVVLTTDNVAEGSTNLYYTDARAISAIATANTYIKKDGTVAFTGNIDAGTHNINNVVDPTTAQQAATKNYVDTAVGAITSDGTRETLNAGESLSATTLIALRFAKAADSGYTSGTLRKADIDATSTDNFHVVGVAYPASGVSSGGAVQITKTGKLTATGHGLTVGTPIYLSSSGAITQTAPTSTSSVTSQACVKLGIVRDANTIEIMIQEIGVL